MELKLSGKTVLVTGASKGIGRAIAESFAAEGCALHLTARSAAELDAAATALRAAYGVDVRTHPLDLSARDAAAALATSTDPIDVLVNNAGAIPSGSLDVVDEETWRTAWDLKVFGYINLTRAVYTSMKRRGAA